MVYASWAHFTFTNVVMERAMLMRCRSSTILNRLAFCLAKNNYTALSSRHRASRFAVAPEREVLTWRNFFLRVDDCFKFLRPLRILVLRGATRRQGTMDG